MQLVVRDNSQTIVQTLMRKNCGLTFLEVLIALVILCGSLAVLSEIARTGLRSASETENMTQAELLCESILAKVQLGIIKQETAVDVPVTESTNSTVLSDTVVDTNAVAAGSANVALWYYSIEINDVENEYDLIEIAVTVRQNETHHRFPVACRMVRWLALEPEPESDTQENQNSSSR